MLTHLLSLIELNLLAIIVMTSVVLCAMSVVLYSSYRSFPSEVQGLREWALASLLLTLATMLFAMRGIWTDWLLAIGANLLMFWGLGLSMIGTQRLFGHRPGWLLFHAVWVAGIACSAWWLLVTPDFAMRVFVFSAFALIFYGVELTLVVRHGERHFSTYLFATFLVVQIASLIGRGASAVDYLGKNSALFDNSVVQVDYVVVSSFMGLMLTVCFLMVATRKLQTVLEHRSNLDALTQVLNRRGFAEHYVKERARMKRDLRPMTLAMIDLDHFKSVNDRFGHAVGDRVLIDVVVKIGEALRETDHVARFGGEEFVILLPATAGDVAHTVAARIQALLREPRADTLPPYTVSIGIACQTQPDEDLDAICQRADRALYQAKNEGRDRIVVA